jgi:hypothetical protein
MERKEGLCKPMVPAGACGLHKPFFVLGEIMEKSMDKVLAPVLNEIRFEGLIERWEKERELKKVRKNRRVLNKVIRESKAILETLHRQGKEKKHG